MFEKIRRFFLHYGLSICVALTILYLCMKPSSDMDLPHFSNSDKIGHALMYLGLSFCICLNFFRQSVPFKCMKMVIWAIIIPICYGGLIEIMQGELTATRSCEMGDLVADGIGAILGYLLASFIVPKFFKENEY